MRFHLAVILWIVALGAASPAWGTVLGVVYQEDFENGAGPEWSQTQTEVTPADGRRYLGRFERESVALTLDQLPPRSELRLSFELFAWGTWDGYSDDKPLLGPDTWQLQVDDGPMLLHTTFSTVTYSNYAGKELHQDYPDAHPDGDHYAGTGAAEVNTLGYTGDPDIYIDTVYNLVFDFEHVGESIVFRFDASNVVPSGESWGLDTVMVAIIPEPCTAMLLVVAAAVLSCRRG